MSTIDHDARLVFVRRLIEELTRRLKTENDEPMPFEEGPISGPQPDRDVGCVWYEGMRPMARDGNIAEEFYRVRVFKRWMQNQGGVEPKATQHSHLLRVQAEVEAALRASLISDGHDFFVVREVTPDHQLQSVEAQLTAYDRNPSAAGG